jgi:hypothetical protein
LLGACDVAQPDVTSGRGPDVQLLGAYPSDGCGIGADPDCTMPPNGSIVLRFDRFLNPATVNRQAIRVYSGDPASFPGLLFNVVYDPVERVVELKLAGGYAYHPGALYSYELIVAQSPGDYGIQAFDGAPLAADDPRLRASFIVAEAPAALSPEPPAPSCAEIVEHVFSEELGACATAACHRSVDNLVAGKDLGAAPHGLWLDSRANLRSTAIGRIARQTETGDESGGRAEDRGARFGVRMALIDPKNPGGSYLMYKLLRNPQNYEACGPLGQGPFCTDADPKVSAHPALPLGKRQTVAPSAEELERLREWFVRGDPMPLDPRGLGLNVGLDGLRAVSAFIASGADCRQ